MPVSLSIELVGVKELQRALTKLPRSQRRKSAIIMRNEARKIMVREWRRMLSRGGSRNRVARRTGALFRSIKPGPASAKKAVVFSDSPYAAIHEFGGKTKAHRITGKSGNVLSFIWPKLGQRVFFMSVNHPGSVMPKRPHREPASRVAFPKIVKRFQQMTDEMARDVAKETRRAKRKRV